MAETAGLAIGAVALVASAGVVATQLTDIVVGAKHYTSYSTDFDKFIEDVNTTLIVVSDRVDSINLWNELEQKIPQGYTSDAWEKVRQNWWKAVYEAISSLGTWLKTNHCVLEGGATWQHLFDQQKASISTLSAGLERKFTKLSGYRVELDSKCVVLAFQIDREVREAAAGRGEPLSQTPAAPTAAQIQASVDPLPRDATRENKIASLVRQTPADKIPLNRKPHSERRGMRRGIEGIADSIQEAPSKIRTAIHNLWSGGVYADKNKIEKRANLPYMRHEDVAHVLLHYTEDQMKSEFVEGNITLKARPEAWFQISTRLKEVKDDPQTVTRLEGSAYSLFMQHAPKSILAYTAGKGKGNRLGKKARKEGTITSTRATCNRS